MSTTVTLEVAQAKLAELVAGLAAGDEIVITSDEQPVAKIVGQKPKARKPRVPGRSKGKIILQTEDDEHLEHFKEYMP